VVVTPDPPDWPPSAPQETRGIYFRTNFTRLTFGELWHICSNLYVFLNMCLTKLLRLPTPLRTAVRHEAIIRVLPADQVPAAARKALGLFAEEFERLGAQLAFYETGREAGKLKRYSVVLLAPEHNAVISVHWIRVEITRRRDVTCCTVTSRLHDGTILSTTTQRRGFLPAPGSKVSHHRTASPAELIQHHQKALAEAASSPVPIADAEQAIQVLLESKHRTFEWHVERGAWVPLTAAEQRRLGIPLGEES
jgi:hypothetical protein